MEIFFGGTDDLGNKPDEQQDNLKDIDWDNFRAKLVMLTKEDLIEKVVFLGQLVKEINTDHSDILNRKNSKISDLEDTIRNLEEELGEMKFEVFSAKDPNSGLISGDGSKSSESNIEDQSNEYRPFQDTTILSINPTQIIQHDDGTISVTL